MNKTYLPCYTDIVNLIIAADTRYPGEMYRSYKLLDDLKNEIAALIYEPDNQPMEYALIQIIKGKIDRRMSYMAKKYLEHNQIDNKTT